MTVGHCVECMAGFYQTREGELGCEPCPHNKPGVGLSAATQQEDCDGKLS